MSTSLPLPSSLPLDSMVREVQAHPDVARRRAAAPRGAAERGPAAAECVPAAARSIAKRLLDVVGAAAGLVLLSPLMIVIALLIRLSSPGPVLFRQQRQGYGGRP